MGTSQHLEDWKEGKNHSGRLEGAANELNEGTGESNRLKKCEMCLKEREDDSVSHAIGGAV